MTDKPSFNGAGYSIDNYCFGCKVSFNGGAGEHVDGADYEGYCGVAGDCAPLEIWGGGSTNVKATYVYPNLDPQPGS